VARPPRFGRPNSGTPLADDLFDPKVPTPVVMEKTLFLIHGMWGGPWCWERYIPFLQSKGYDCIAATLRHHACDPAVPPNPQVGRTSLLDYAADLELEIRRLLGTPIIMGHSMGGLLAQMLAARGLAERLVLLTPAAPAGIWGITSSVIRGFLSAQLKWCFWRRPIRPTFNEFVYSSAHLLPPEERKEAYSRLVYDSGRAAFEMGYWFLDSRRASRVDASRVTCPTLIVGGGRDRITPASVVRKVAARYARVATYREFPDHAHWVLAEPGWQDVAEVVGGWLEQCE